MNKQDKIVREAIIESLVTLRMVHVWERDWYKKEDVREYISDYYGKIHKIIQTANRRYWELIRCADCGIYLITSCSNRGRKDIRCPFGCRDCHKKEASKERSTAYYQTDYGIIKRQIQNAKRNRGSSKRSTEDEKEKASSSEEKKESFVGHVRLILSLIEGRFISWQEIKSIILDYFDKWKQHPLEYWLKLCNMTA